MTQTRIEAWTFRNSRPRVRTVVRSTAPGRKGQFAGTNQPVAPVVSSTTLGYVVVKVRA